MNNEAFLIFLIVVCTLFIQLRLRMIDRRMDRLSRLDAKIDTLLKHAGMTFDEFYDVPPGVREPLEEGKRILAIQRYRELTGAGLVEAKAFTEEIRRRGFNMKTGR